MPKVIFFNGPPGSGKDTIVSALAPEVTRLSFADPLKTMVDRAFYMRRREGPDKDDPMAEPFSTQTYRNTLIAYAERFMKPLFGRDIFGMLALQDIVCQPKVAVWGVSDFGFAEEAKVLVDHLGRSNCAVVQVYREGKNFDNDSRGWIDHSDIGASFTCHFDNNRPIESIRPRILAFLGKWIARPAE